MGGNEVWKEAFLPVFSRMQHVGKLKYNKNLTSIGDTFRPDYRK